MELEICADSVESCLEAVAGGADRIELCSALTVGGLTPSQAFIRWAVGSLHIPVHVLIRLRPFDFIYSEDEVEIMLSDIIFAKEAGAAGVVIGALTTQGKIDFDITKRLIKAAGSIHITFHRAFDECVGDPVAIAHGLYNLGVRRLLTSGRATSAEDGVAIIAKLQRGSPPDFAIMAGSGITPQNCRQVLDKTNVTCIHASAKVTRAKLGQEAAPARVITSAHVVAQLRLILDSAGNNDPSALETFKTAFAKAVYRILNQRFFMEQIENSKNTF